MTNLIKTTSVLIITRNRSLILGHCLDALRPQIDSARHEVIVVDSSEKEDTTQLIQKYPWVSYHRIELPLGTRPQSYTYGAERAQGEIVALLDDDAIVHPGWLLSLENCYEDEKVGAAGGRVLAKQESGVRNQETEKRDDLSPTSYLLPPVINRVLPDGRIVSNLYLDPGHQVEVDTLRGCNMSVRKDLLAKVGYFDARFRGQNCRVEDDACLGIKRLGYKIIFEPKAVVTHLAEERPDIPRSEFSARSEFYVWRNTVWLYIKHFGFTPSTILRVGILTPIRICLRRVLGGSFKKPKMTQDGLHYLPAALAGIWGGIWGLVMSMVYTLQDQFQCSNNRQYAIDNMQKLPISDNRLPIAHCQQASASPK